MKEDENSLKGHEEARNRSPAKTNGEQTLFKGKDLILKQQTRKA